MHQNQAALLRFVIPAPLATAAKQVRSCLQESGLVLTVDTDVTGTIHRRMGVGLAACRMFGVVCPRLLLESAVADPGALALLPVHLLLAEHERRTDLYVLNPRADQLPIPAVLAVKIGDLVERITAVVATIAARQPAAPIG